MKDINFTDEQRELIEITGSLFIEACPGAGKTQSIVERYIRRPNCVDRRGVALLSFTRAASEEARRRCAENVEFLEAPNFVGTIDSFINRFIVTPIYSVCERKAPTFRDSWESAPGTSFELNYQQVSGISFELNWFEFDQNGNAEWSTRNIPYSERKLLRRLPRWIRDRALEVAAARWRELIQAGFVDCDYARELMYSFLADSQTRERMSQFIRDRFCEVIVDEAQDCDRSDVYLLRFLLDSAVNLVMVGDLEQSIYGFRGSTLNEVLELSNTVPRGSRMNKNFRSSPSICAVIDSLRHTADRDGTAGPCKTVTTPVYLMHAPDFDGVNGRVKELLKAQDHSPSEFIYLAHAEWVARKCADAGTKPASSKARLVRLAAASSVLHDHSLGNSTERRRALQVVQAILRDSARAELQSVGDRQFFEDAGLSSYTFQEGCQRLSLRAHPQTCTPDEYLECVREGIEALGWSSWIDKGRLRGLKENRWPEYMFPAPHSSLWSTVHRFKGLEFPGVGLAIPRHSIYRMENSAVNDWELGSDGEGRRVLYVGASRAEKLLILIVDDQTDFLKVQKILTLTDVPFEIAPRGS